MVIAYGMGEEIGSISRIGETDNQLGATEVGLRLVAHEFAFSNETALKVA